jgi:hypothetical protein
MAGELGNERLQSPVMLTIDLSSTIETCPFTIDIHRTEVLNLHTKTRQIISALGV